MKQRPGLACGWWKEYSGSGTGTYDGIPTKARRMAHERAVEALFIWKQLGSCS